MTPEERFERIEQDLHMAAGLILQVSDRLDRVSDQVDRVSARLHRAVRLGVEEVRRERRRRRELDERLAQLAATVQAFIESLKQGGNGHH